MTLPHDLLRTVPMVGIDVDNGTSLASRTVLFVREGVHGSCGDVVEETKAAGFCVGEEAVDAGVVSGGTDDAECVAISANEYALR
mmetsp:Transcript_12677/g.22218  ORF Transcript_12677/g.22218 Transcript_12677/m.22218 type:complete len:85 (+) Transcript_12677:1230-1484(+)